MKPVFSIAAGLLTVLSPLTIASASGESHAHRSKHTPSYATPVQLVHDKAGYNNFRPVLNADATQVVFERYSVSAPNNVTLFYANLPGGSPQPFTTLPSTRPDWCWQRSGNTLTSGKVAFSNGNGIFTMDAPGDTPTNLPNTTQMAYPTWYPDCSRLAVDNGKIQETTVIDSTSGTVLVNSLQKNSPIWGGFASVNQANPNLVAFAGQNNLESSYYNQNLNYTWVVNSAIAPMTPHPMDRQAPAGPSFLQKYQARAGTWSPDGQWFAFESNRSCPDVSGLTYAIFIQAANGQTPAQQVTDCTWSIEHPKWFPPGSNGGKPTLVAAGIPPSGGPFEIISLDVSNFIGNARKTARHLLRRS